MILCDSFKLTYTNGYNYIVVKFNILTDSVVVVVVVYYPVYERFKKKS